MWFNNGLALSKHQNVGLYYGFRYQKVTEACEIHGFGIIKARKHCRLHGFGFHKTAKPFKIRGLGLIKAPNALGIPWFWLSKGHL